MRIAKFLYLPASIEVILEVRDRYPEGSDYVRLTEAVDIEFAPIPGIRQHIKELRLANAKREIEKLQKEVA